MGYWEGPGKYNSPDPVEFRADQEDQLRQKMGTTNVRVTNELEETLFIDRLQLVTIEHPSDVAVFPNEGMTDPPKPFGCSRSRMRGRSRASAMIGVAISQLGYRRSIASTLTASSFCLFAVTPRRTTSSSISERSVHRCFC
jgi:hypothetical protein